MDLDPQAVEQAVRGHVDPYPFALKMLGGVIRGAIAAGAMGTDELGTFVDISRWAAQIVRIADPASLPLLTGESA